MPGGKAITKRFIWGHSSGPKLCVQNLYLNDDFPTGYLVITPTLIEFPGGTGHLMSIDSVSRPPHTGCATDHSLDKSLTH